MFDGVKQGVTNMRKWVLGTQKETEKSDMMLEQVKQDAEEIKVKSEVIRETVQAAFMTGRTLDDLVRGVRGEARE